MTNSSTFRVADEAIRVQTSEPALSRWLEEFFRGAFDPTGPLAAAGPRVHVSVDPGRHRALVALGENAAPRRVELFTLDGAFISAPLVIDESGRRWAQGRESGAFVGADASGTDVEVVVEEAQGWGRGEVMRVVRELATATLLRRGWLPLHASGFVIDGRATLLCGPKHSGKTSLLIHALRGGARYLANDRAFVSTGPQPVARGLPTIVMIRRGTLERFPGMKERYDQEQLTWTRTVAECAPGIEREAPRSGDPEKLPGLGPVQFAGLVPAELHEGPAPLARLVFPAIDPEVRGLLLEPLSPRAALPRLLEGLLAPSRPLRESELFCPVGGRFQLSADQERERAESLLASCQAFTCRVGVDAYREPFNTRTFPRRSP